jgi:hypothetical protein
MPWFGFLRILPIYPFDEKVALLLPRGLNIHDAIICATGLWIKEVEEEEVIIITRDREIQEIQILPTIWGN